MVPLLRAVFMLVGIIAVAAAARCALKGRYGLAAAGVVTAVANPVAFWLTKAAMTVEDNLDLDINYPTTIAAVVGAAFAVFVLPLVLRGAMQRAIAGSWWHRTACRPPAASLRPRQRKEPSAFGVGFATVSAAVILAVIVDRTQLHNRGHAEYYLAGLLLLCALAIASVAILKGHKAAGTLLIVGALAPFVTLAVALSRDCTSGWCGFGTFLALAVTIVVITLPSLVGGAIAATRFPRRNSPWTRLSASTTDNTQMLGNPWFQHHIWRSRSRWLFVSLGPAAVVYIVVFASLGSTGWDDRPPAAWAVYAVAWAVGGGYALTALFAGASALAGRARGWTTRAEITAASLPARRPVGARHLLGSAFAAAAALALIGLLVVALVIGYAYDLSIAWGEAAPLIALLGFPALGLLVWSFALARRAVERNTPPTHGRVSTDNVPDPGGLRADAIAARPLSEDDTVDGELSGRLNLNQR